jgi:hypothetical protein
LKIAGDIMADDVCEMRPTGRIDSATGPAFEKDVLRQIEEGKRRMLLDFAELVYISSAGLRVVLLAAKRMKSAGGKLAQLGGLGIHLIRKLTTNIRYERVGERNRLTLEFEPKAAGSTGSKTGSRRAGA